MDGVCISIDRSRHDHFLALCPFPSFEETFSSVLDLVCGGSWTASECVSVRYLLDYFLDGFRDHVSKRQHSWLHKLGDFLTSVALLPSCAPRLVHCVKSFVRTVLPDYDYPLLFSKAPYAGFRYSRPVGSVSSLGSSVVVLKLLPYHSAPFGASRPPVFCWPTSLVALCPVPLGEVVGPTLLSLSSPYSPLQRPSSGLLVVPGCVPPWALVFLCPGVDPPSVLLVVPGCDPPQSLVFSPPGVDPPWRWLSGMFCPMVGSLSGVTSSWFSVGPFLPDGPAVLLSLALHALFYPFGFPRVPVSVFLWCPLVGDCLSVGLVVGLLVWSKLALLHLS